jgi:hypothetical protein
MRTNGADLSAEASAKADHTLINDIIERVPVP